MISAWWLLPAVAIAFWMGYCVCGVFKRNSDLDYYRALTEIKRQLDEKIESLNQLNEKAK